MENETSLIQVIRRLMARQNDLIVGKVVSENPLTVQGLNDEKLMLGVNTLILSKQFRDDPLTIGEEIYILVFNDGKGYYVLDRR